jgi:hypothetical protein
MQNSRENNQDLDFTLCKNPLETLKSDATKL